MRNKYLVGVVIALLLSGCAITSDFEVLETSEIDYSISDSESASEGVVNSENKDNVIDLPTEDELSTKENNKIYVYVCGAVINPGVYELPIGSRAFEALDAAGGAKEDAAAYLVNLAEVVTDEQKLYIPAIGEDYTLDSTLSTSESKNASSKVNINTATKEQLMTLSGIGSSKAEAIISYREQNGNFTSIEKIMEVNGIKEAAYARIKDQISVE